MCGILAMPAPGPAADGTIAAGTDGAGRITFNRDLAPVVFRHCAPCHRPGGAGPFSLLAYSEARRHAREIAEVTRRRLMPPWLPEGGESEWKDARSLSESEVRLFQRWLEEGAAEGDSRDLPPAPVFSPDWQLGPPDLDVELPDAYALGPEGPDVYRNFVIPLPLASNKVVSAFEFHPGSPSVHHARILFDHTGQCRRLDGRDSEPGFAGMNLPAKFPPGQLLAWTPGRQPRRNPPELNWVLESGSDLVLQMHMQRTGKQESVRPRIGLYFTDTPPARTPFVMGVVAQWIDIPPGATNVTVTRSFEMPADAQLLAIMPHAHYLAREVVCRALTAGGPPRVLLRIPRWDFNWQDLYRYQNPPLLARGTRIEFSITYDNSEANPRNPHRPPRRVTYGPQSSDEMGEIWLQLMPGNPAALAALRKEKSLMDGRETAVYYRNILEAHPDDAAAHVGLGKALGPLGQSAEAARHFEAALALDPACVEAHYYLGAIFFEKRQYPEARREFEGELRLDPNCYKAEVGLGLICIQEQDLEQAERHLRAATRANPADPGAQEILGRIVKARAGPDRLK